MPPRRRVRARRVLGVALVGLAAAACARGLLEDDGPCPEVRVRIGDDVLIAEVTNTEARRHLGLSGRPSLAPDRGLLFPYDEPSRPRFVMRDMHFDIDIVWIRDGRIVDLTHEAPHRVSGALPRYQSRTAIDNVIEVPAGTARTRGWSIGDEVVIEAGDER